MSDRRLQVFMAVAHRLSFTKAAEDCCMTQPAITFQIKQFEQDLEIDLFSRKHNRVALTAAGEVVLEHVKRISSAYAEMYSATSQLKGLAITLYRPADNAEAEAFRAAHCDQCRHQPVDFGYCRIYRSALANELDAPGYPREWRFEMVGGCGMPVCTEFAPLTTQGGEE